MSCAPFCGRPASSWASRAGRASPARVRELAGDDPLLMSIVAPLLEVLDAMLEQTARLTKKILDIVRQEPICRRLMSVPGVGPITALDLPRHHRPAGEVQTVRARSALISA